jgi:phenylacetate-CoA ligase
MGRQKRVRSPAHDSQAAASHRGFGCASTRQRISLGPEITLPKGSMLHRAIINGVRGFTGSLILFPLVERLEGRDMRGKQRLFAAEMALPFRERRARSWAATVETIRQAAKSVPYYRELFARTRFDPDSLARDPKFLNDIPFLTKDIIRSEGERLLRDDHAAYRRHETKTGGSTGPSAQIFYDQEAADWSSAVTRYARTLVGAYPMRSELHFASRFPEQIPWKERMREQVKCLSNNRYNIFFSSFEPDELEQIWRQIENIRPYLVHGHPSTLYQLALYVEEKYGGKRAFNIFESSGELLEDKRREIITRAFDCTVIDRYGLAELGVAAYQTDPEQPGMLVFDPVAWPEITATETGADLPEVEGAETGELVFTALKNKMMPLIRYRSGDMATMRDTPAGFTIEHMVGRVHEVVEIAGRRLPTHYVQDVLDRIGAVKEFQIEIRNGRPILRIVAEPGVDPLAFRDRLAGWWGDAVDIEFIESTALHLQGRRAKFRHLISPATDN